MRVSTDNNEQWLAERTKGIGGSDAGAIAGVNKYKTPLEVYLEKIGEKIPADLSQNNAVQWGIKLEDLIAEEYKLNHPDRNVYKTSFIWVSDEYPFMRCNPDRLINSDGILEIKTVGYHSKEEWTDTDVPESYAIQCQHMMCVLDRKWCDVAVLFAGREYKEYRIERDNELISNLIKIEQAFWCMVETKTPPEPSTSNDIRLMWPLDKGGSIDASDDVVSAITSLKELREGIKSKEEETKILEDKIKLFMKDNQTLTYIGVPIATWKSSERKSYTVPATTIRTLRLK